MPADESHHSTWTSGPVAAKRSPRQRRELPSVCLVDLTRSNSNRGLRSLGARSLSPRIPFIPARSREFHADRHPLDAVDERRSDPLDGPRELD